MSTILIFIALSIFLFFPIDNYYNSRFITTFKKDHYSLQQYLPVVLLIVGWLTFYMFETYWGAIIYLIYITYRLLKYLGLFFLFLSVYKNYITLTVPSSTGIEQPINPVLSYMFQHSDAKVFNMFITHKYRHKNSFIFFDRPNDFSVYFHNPDAELLFYAPNGRLIFFFSNEGYIREAMDNFIIVRQGKEYRTFSREEYLAIGVDVKDLRSEHFELLKMMQI